MFCVFLNRYLFFIYFQIVLIIKKKSKIPFKFFSTIFFAYLFIGLQKIVVFLFDSFVVLS